MKLNTTHKILIGIAIGGGVAYLLHKRKEANSVQATKKTVTASGTVEDADNPTTRDGKVEYILANTDTTATEEKSGFGGDRFQYNPMLGYSLPIGTVTETNSGAEMGLSREGYTANEIFFNAEGEATDDPTAEAESIVNEMSNEEVDLAYKMVKAKKNNPELPASAIANKLRLGDGAKAMFARVILPRIQDIKALKKSPKWKAKWEERKAYFKAKMANKINSKSAHANNKKGRKPIFGHHHVKNVESSNEYYKKGRKPIFSHHNSSHIVTTNSKENRQKDFAEQVSGNRRREGSTWGGFRNDGVPTNANA